ncbi:hypothetical protein GCM10027346_24200 [Hymenobacter seoulensis]
MGRRFNDYPEEIQEHLASEMLELVSGYVPAYTHISQVQRCLHQPNPEVKGGNIPFYHQNIYAVQAELNY